MRYKGLKQEAYDFIYEKLMHNSIQPGERIREDLIADEIGVSRTPVREAVNQLVAEGFIVNVPRKGLFAASISKDDILKMIDVRIALEVLAVERCCTLATEEELSKLEEINALYHEKIQKLDYLETAQADEAFHTHIASLSRNEKLQQFLRDLMAFFMYAKARSFKTINESGMQQSLDEHKEIIAALRTRDADRAKNLMAEHLQHLRYIADDLDT